MRLMFFTRVFFLFVLIQSRHAVAKVTYSNQEEAALVACNYVSRNSKPFKNNYADATTALAGEWVALPSADFDFNKFLSQPDTVSYRGAYCENTLQLLIMKSLKAPDNNRVIDSRCKSLIATKSFMQEIYTGKNDYLASQDKHFLLPDAFLYWNNKERKSVRDANPSIDIACQSYTEKEKAMNSPVSKVTGQRQTAYLQAFKELIGRCEVIKKTDKAIHSSLDN